MALEGVLPDRFIRVRLLLEGRFSPFNIYVLRRSAADERISERVSSLIPSDFSLMDLNANWKVPIAHLGHATVIRQSQERSGPLVTRVWASRKDVCGMRRQTSMCGRC